MTKNTTDLRSCVLIINLEAQIQFITVHVKTERVILLVLPLEEVAQPDKLVGLQIAHSIKQESHSLDHHHDIASLPTRHHN